MTIQTHLPKRTSSSDRTFRVFSLNDIKYCLFGGQKLMFFIPICLYTICQSKKDLIAISYRCESGVLSSSSRVKVAILSYLHVY